MKKRLFIIGNGFDLAHGLPTSFVPDFKCIAERNEPDPRFWELYQSHEPEIWSDFENLLAKPNFNNLEEIFSAYTPDYSSEHEYERDGIVVMSDISGNLDKALNEFAKLAEDSLKDKVANKDFSALFSQGDLYVSFNYTHTLERLYKIEPPNILHIHGEVGKSQLLLGYPDGEFAPEPYAHDPTMKGYHFASIDIQNYIEEIEDFYTQNAFSTLYKKIESFSKAPQISKMERFICGIFIDEIVVWGHSYKIDFRYFKYLGEKFPGATWTLHYYSEDDKMNLYNLVNRIGLEKYTLVQP